MSDARSQELVTRFGRTQEQVAQEVGKSRPHVANTLRLLKLPESVQALLRVGRLTAGHARTLLGAADPEAMAREILAARRDAVVKARDDRKLDDEVMREVLKI